MLAQLTSFDKMITPTIIKILFWIGILQAFGLSLVIIIAGFGAAANAASEHSPLGSPYVPLGLIGGVLVFIVSVFLTRIYCELMIISFRIYETLVEIRDRTAPSPIPPSVSAAYYPSPASLP